jgi:hypothetical protein
LVAPREIDRTREAWPRLEFHSSEKITMALSFRKLLAPALLVVAACGPTRYQVQSPKAPDADAVVLADIDEAAKLTRLTITVSHLAPPGRIASGASAYVVWARGDEDKPWARVGALDYDEEDRLGELENASVGEIEFELTITAESKGDAEQPSSEVIFRQQVAD